MPVARVVDILQPVYLPWMGYFEQMAYCDHFVFMDSVQYTRGDWRNRNRIKTASGPIWLTVPVKRHGLHTLIRDVEIDYSLDWRKKHLRSIEQNYRKCAYFQPLYDDLVDALNERVPTLLELDCKLIQLMCRYLEITTTTSFSSTIPDSSPRPPNGGRIGERNQRLLDICRTLGASRFYVGAKAEAYLDVQRFANAGIEVIFQKYEHPVYPQRFGDFVSHQSTLDLIMNTGPRAPEILRSSPVPPSLSDMHSQPCRSAAHD